MATTRRLPAMQIYHDTDEPHIDLMNMASQSTRNMMGTVLSDHHDINVLAPRSHITFSPPSEPNAYSPSKPHHRTNSSPPKALLNLKENILLPPPQTPAFITDSPSKKPLMPSYRPIAPQMPQKSLFTTFPSTRQIDKENIYPAYHSDNVAVFGDAQVGFQMPTKRSLSEAVPSDERQLKKSRLEEILPIPIPEPHNMPLLDDDGSKPPYSYASLIGMAILRAPNRRLTLSNIYKWISDTFSHYRTSAPGWQNSIRHNLTLNKAFVKQVRPKDEAGKGNYWAIEPGMEGQFVKDKPGRRPMSSSGQSMKSFSQISSEPNLSSSTGHVRSNSKPRLLVTAASEPSSDATIPNSDPVVEEDDIEEVLRMPPPSSRPPPSSPGEAIQSSPPIVRMYSHRATSPSTSRYSVSYNSSKSRGRKSTGMDDSGYFSALDSSITRPSITVNDGLPDISIDRPRIKRGRAEEEIARIRSSSHDISPSKGRSLTKQPTPQLISSSPPHQFDSSLMLPPLTPATTFPMPTLPAKPPASVSPNTNLRNHRNKIRELVGSPLGGAGLSYDEVSLSPAFNIGEDDPYMYNDGFAGRSFNIYSDSPAKGCSASALGSPEKRSTRRPQLDRATTTASVLAEVTGAGVNRKTLTPFLQAPFLESPVRKKSPNRSPSKLSAFGSALVDACKEDDFGFDLFADEEPDDSGGFDILQGFQKIGGKDKENAAPKKVARPPLGSRSQTSRF